MSAELVMELTCDKCGSIEYCYITTYPFWIDNARKKGWKIGSKIMCPKCKVGQ